MIRQPEWSFFHYDFNTAPSTKSDLCINVKIKLPAWVVFGNCLRNPNNFNVHFLMFSITHTDVTCWWKRPPYRYASVPGNNIWICFQIPPPHCLITLNSCFHSTCLWLEGSMRRENRTRNQMSKVVIVCKSPWVGAVWTTSHWKGFSLHHFQLLGSSGPINVIDSFLQHRCSSLLQLHYLTAT